MKRSLVSVVICLTPPFNSIISCHTFGVNSLFDIFLKSLYTGVKMTRGDDMSEKDRWTQESQTRFTMRIDTKLLDKIKEEALNTKRSTAKQIEFILEEWLRKNESER